RIERVPKWSRIEAWSRHPHGFTSVASTIAPSTPANTSACRPTSRSGLVSAATLATPAKIPVKTNPAKKPPCIFAHSSARSGSDQSARADRRPRSEEHTSELQSRFDLVCRLLLEKKKPHARQRSACPRGRYARQQPQAPRRYPHLAQQQQSAVPGRDDVYGGTACRDRGVGFRDPQ